MGLYRAVARPLFYSLPPETAHRWAQSILSLPLPWERIGGTPKDPALRASLAGIELSNPVGLAAGFDKSCRHLDALGRLGFGYVIGGTITRDPRSGNAKPRIARYPGRGSMTNAMGLPNPGAEAAARTLSRSPRSGPRLASIADQGPGPRQRGPPGCAPAGARRAAHEADVREAPSLPERRRARGGAGARTRRAGRRRRRAHLFQHSAGLRPAPVGGGRRALRPRAVPGHGTDRGGRPGGDWGGAPHQRVWRRVLRRG